LRNGQWGDSDRSPSDFTWQLPHEERIEVTYLLRTNNLRVSLALLLCGISGGSLFIFVKLLVGEITPLQLAASRAALGAVILLSIVLAGRAMSPLTKPLILGAIILALVDTTTPYLLIAWGSQHVPSATAALLVSTMPLFTTMIASVRLPDERLTGTIAGGLALSAIGVVVLTGPGALDLRNSSTIAAFAVLLSALCYAVGVVYSRFLLRLSSPMSLTALKLTFAAMFLVPIAAAIDGVAGFASLSAIGWVGIFEVCVISTGFGRSLLQWVVKTADSVRASMVTYIIPVVTLAISWTIVGDPVRTNTLAGAMMVMGGVALVMYGPQVLRARIPLSRPTRVPIGSVRLGRQQARAPEASRFNAGRRGRTSPTVPGERIGPFRTF
jgi:drug/metabolite transporter (DMT)-like permease